MVNYRSKMHLIGYCRVSSKGQENNTSLDAQAERMDEWCKAQGHELCVIYRGVESGAGLDRESFWHVLRLLVCSDCPVSKYPKSSTELKIALEAKCQCGGGSRFDGIIAFDLDRIGRNARDVLWLGYDFLRTRGKELVVLNGIGKCDTTSAIGKLMYGQLAVYAEFYRNNLVEKSDHGRKKKADAGEYVAGRPPYGLRRIAPGKLQEDPYELETLRIMQLLDCQGMGMTQIAKILNGHQRYKRDGKPWGPNDVYALLKGKSKAIRDWWATGCKYNYIKSARGY